MNSELENILNNLLSKGQLTDRSRELLILKAEQLGVDVIDFELELEARIADSKTKTPLPLSVNNKEGVVIKCPGCGEPTKSFMSECPSCGLEFRSVVNRSAILLLVQQLKEIEIAEWETNEYKGQAGFEYMIRNSIASKQCPLIDNYPIPNSKEEIFEFLSMALPISQKQYSWTEHWSRAGEKQLSQSYKAKAQQAIIKGRLLFKDDKSSLEQLNYYSQQLGI